MIRLACVLLLSSILGLAQGQAPSGQPSSDGRAQTAQPATLTPAPVSTPGSITVPAGTKVLLTMVGGKVVYQSAELEKMASAMAASR